MQQFSKFIGRIFTELFMRSEKMIALFYAAEVKLNFVAVLALDILFFHSM